MRSIESEECHVSANTSRHKQNLKGSDDGVRVYYYSEFHMDVKGLKETLPRTE
jgi:hypothetical protein